ncbi:MAG: 4Fe-4S binding protein [Prolixibacteraceae bacterium]|jgi:polyferredoxin|nr:4Fe-4S binding protein [Prolixibacteraceae bacterium]
MMLNKKLRLPAAVFLFVFFLLGMVQWKMADNPILIAERFWKGAGWVQLGLIALYGAFVAWKMQDPTNVPQWRRITWTLFSIVFFAQLGLGLLGAEKFLMTGKLHLPIPMMIVAGPLHRMQLSFMTILFISTIILTGPAWCSHLCYFGAMDNLAAQGRGKAAKLKNQRAIKSTVLILVVAAALGLRWFNVPTLATTLIAVAFGLTGIGVMIFFSRKHKKMVHCTLYCPIGTVVNLTKPVNPFRMYIDLNCDLCMKCTSYCKYDALGVRDIKNKKPGFNCTLCGDCLTACRHNSIKYKFFNLSPQASRNLYLFLTISLHAAFLALAKI